MNPRRLSRLVSWCIAVSLLFSGSFGILVCDRASAKSDKKDRDNDSRRADKISPDLRSRVRKAQRNRQENKGDEDVKVILQFNGPASPQLVALLNSNGVKVRK